MTHGNETKTILSDERLLDLIEALHERSTAGVTELAQATDLSKGAVHAHLATLEGRGFVVNNEGRYRLGLEFLRHGIPVRNQYEYEAMCAKAEQLAEETGERVWAQVEENGMAYYVCGARGEHHIEPPVRIGERAHLHQIAGGKAMLSCLTDDRIREIVAKHGLPAATEHTITDEETLFAEIERIRERGYAYNREESVLGLHAVSTPIKKDAHGVYGALVISGPANRLTGEKLESELPKLLLGAVNELEINIRYS
ncbi:IclR family transcriptional regulator [Halomicroarcula limicola]|uniref:IclR family transcriptional regulator n=1 Tax=Haloarcula limicola TaxID=1429915 RepID=A0A8J7YD48_9EURY|nr:IclR family transcriptional regulator [Halomicroarcula limicola]MBV0926298.1 IclR family transcriptional regulator [Halomicroarcula limicola]